MSRLFIAGHGIAILVLALLSATATGKVAVLLASCIAVGLALVWLSWMSVKHKPRWPVLAVGSLVIVVAASVIITAWPLRLSYLFSRPSLEQLAIMVQAGEQPVCPIRVGFFVIKQTEVSGQGAVCLWTVLDPAGNTGFVRSDASNLPLNLWSRIQLDERWSLVVED